MYSITHNDDARKGVFQKSFRGFEKSVGYAAGVVMSRGNPGCKQTIIDNRGKALERAHSLIKNQIGGWQKWCKEALFESVSLGNSDAVIELANAFASNRFGGEHLNVVGDILALLCTAAANGSSSAARALYCKGFEYKLDHASDWKNITNALEIITAASDIGLTWGKYCLGRFKFFGQCGMEKNLEEARCLIKEAAVDDFNPSERANRHIALCIFDGVGGYEKDIDRALVYARSAGALKEATICEMLNRTDMCKGSKFVAGQDLGEQIDFRQLGKLMQDATENYRRLHNADWVNSGRELGHDVAWHSCKCPQYGICAYLMSRTRAKKWSDRHARSQLQFASDSYLGRGIIVEPSHIFSGGSEDDRMRRIDFSIGDFLTKRLPIVFSRLANLDSRLAKFDFANLDGFDFSKEELLDYLKYLRRYILWDRKGGVKLIDGSIQQEIIAKNVEVPIATKWIGEVFKKDAPKAANPTVALSSSKLKNSNSGQKKSSSSKAVQCVSRSSKKRWLFILIGLFVGLFGLHFLYARRKGWFVFYWLLLIANFAHANVSAVANLMPAVAKIPVFGLLAGLIFVGSIFFMKKDGDGNRM